MQDEIAAVIRLLKHVRVLDCGAHYCRYCPAKSPAWEHTPSCPYEESQRIHDEAQAMIARLSTAFLLSGEARDDWEAAKLRAYRQARIWEPNMDAYHGAMSVYDAAFGNPEGEPSVVLPDGRTAQPHELATRPLASPHGPSSGEGCRRRLDLCMACPDYPWLASPDFLRELNALRDEIVARDPSTLALWQKHQRVAFLLPRLPLPAPPQESSREETT
jgi:hypothetical protein